MVRGRVNNITEVSDDSLAVSDKNISKRVLFISDKGNFRISENVVTYTEYLSSICPDLRVITTEITKSHTLVAMIACIGS